MNTKRIWRREVEEKRGRTRVPADFYAVELSEGGRYLRRITNISGDGLLLHSPLADEQPGQVIHLELPLRRGETPLTVEGEVVYVTDRGQVGVHVTSTRLPVDGLGGLEAL
ncbi:MAG TPA: PilZ domain-containing protein [Polyangia bacterium]|nr:PilZ domain-containing protein [Polyangia bacterium]